MKFFAILSILALTLVKEAQCTQLETCNCDEIKQLVVTTVQDAVSGMEKKSAIFILNKAHSAVLVFSRVQLIIILLLRI